MKDLYDLVEQDWTLNERSSLTKSIHHLKPGRRLLGDLDANSITPAAIEGYKLTRIREGAAKGTVNNELSILRRAFSLAVEQELLPKVPKVRLLAVSNARKGFLEPGDFWPLFRTLETLDAPVAHVVQWLYFIGWRKQEACGLTWDEVDVDTGTVQLPPSRNKTRKMRTLRVGLLLQALLKQRLALKQGPFVFHRSGKRLIDFRGTWKRAVRERGKPRLLVHDLRRSFARNAVLAGIDVKTVMECGGWTTRYTFDRYDIVDEGRIETALNTLSDYANQKRKAEC